VLAASLDEAVAAVDRIAPEHLEILAEDGPALAARVRNAGAIFIGEWSPVPVGDFYAGPNHVLPTGGTARFASPLGVQDFVKRTGIVRYTRRGLERGRKDIEAFARAEGFEAHARAISVRFET
ncbi:MAG: histidinol dehydrogenase, partial [Vicinamibacteria bacterium]